MSRIHHRVANLKDLVQQPGIRYFFDGGDTGLQTHLRLHEARVAQDVHRKYEMFGPEHDASFRPRNGVYLSRQDILDFTADGRTALLSEGIDVPVVVGDFKVGFRIRRRI
jgi:hypothetical protein